ncbi:MAG: neutral/alkaline non-lysosomal ceramidase N-terminal domain-containing protein [Planctomycetaceae bacterium]|nr:neutral/alkaline non-lysosomal ceramidase N-terminal domain-containing protein [Planctomycetales bacterium]MCB9923486.1 neutral/alkaline non-lysosomal ceramidase N-terminal domain-containing protein [Planctomycetaceae bacterium]
MTICVNPRQSLAQFGVARGDITPPVGIYHRMWGAATHDRSTGVHRQLTATVLAIEPIDSDDHQCRKIIVAIDHCLLWAAEMKSLLDRVAERAAVERDSITVFFSHTHAAGLMGLERCELPGGELIPQYLDDLASTIAGLTRDAIATTQPASITYENGRCSLAANRDYFDVGKGAHVCGFNPDGQADDLLVVARVTNEHGTILATIVNYACHPTTLAWDNTLISPDYVGAMREVIEDVTGAPCFFIQGASGDVGPREGFVGDVLVADRNGRQLGYAALSALEAMGPAKQQFAYAGPVISGATIGTWHYVPDSDDRLRQARVWRTALCEVELPFREDLPRRSELLDEQKRWQAEEQAALDNDDLPRSREARAMVERATRRLVRVEHLEESKAFSYRAELWRVGDAIWIPLDGEHYNVLQRSLRQRFPEFTLLIGTLANGSNVWYLPDANSYGKGLYQEEASILARGCLETLGEALVATIEKLGADLTE